MLADDILYEVHNDKKVKKLIDDIYQKADSFIIGNKYSVESSRLIGQYLSEAIPDINLIERESVCKALLRGEHEQVNKLLAMIQKRSDAKIGLKLNAVKPAANFDRINQIATSMMDETVPIETIQRRCRNGVENVARSFYDKFIQVNAESRKKMGIQGYIVRIAAPDCCSWCTAIAGRYEYGQEPDGIYRRHDKCNCTVTYENGRERQNVWTKEKWMMPLQTTTIGTKLTDSEIQAIQSKKSLKVG